MERAKRTMREGLEEGEFSNYLELEAALAAIWRRYHEDRLHSALGYQHSGSSIEEIHRGGSRSEGSSFTMPDIADAIRISICVSEPYRWKTWQAPSSN
jgi:hypothetical protein